jgi:hypothetical protein
MPFVVLASSEESSFLLSIWNKCPCLNYSITCLHVSHPLRKSSTQGNPPHGENQTYYRTLPVSNNDHDYTFDYMNIVPGGRFLATVSVELSGSLKVLQLYDLGLGIDMQISPHSVASISLGYDDIHFDPDSRWSGPFRCCIPCSLVRSMTCDFLSDVENTLFSTMRIFTIFPCVYWVCPSPPILLSRRKVDTFVIATLRWSITATPLHARSALMIRNRYVRWAPVLQIHLCGPRCVQ